MTEPSDKTTVGRINFANNSNLTMEDLADNYHKGYNNGYQEGFDKGESVCAASQWHSRTDTQGLDGEVVEDAELPEKVPDVEYLAMLRREDGGHFVVYGWDYQAEEWFDQFLFQSGPSDEWLRKHLIAWAEVRW